MDTKSRSFRKKLVAGGSVVFVAAAGIAFVTGCMLALCYSLDYWETRIPTVQDNISILWMVEVAVFFIALLALIIALWKTGEKDENGKIKLNWFDRLFTDLQIVAGGLAVFGIGLMSYIYFDILVGGQWYAGLLGELSETQLREYNEWYAFNPSQFEPRWLEIFFAVLATAFLFSFALPLSCALSVAMPNVSFNCSAVDYRKDRILPLRGR